MCNLISGKEAKLSWANGEELEFYSPDLDVWFGLNDEPFMSDVFDTRPIRLKPRTIKINNIEVPAPFEPKCMEDFYVIDGTHSQGWIIGNPANPCPSMGNTKWRTKEEVKQVVAALREVFK